MVLHYAYIPGTKASKELPVPGHGCHANNDDFMQVDFAMFIKSAARSEIQITVVQQNAVACSARRI